MMVKNLKLVFVFTFVIAALVVSGCANNNGNSVNDDDDNNEDDNDDTSVNSMLEFNQCLADNDVVIYGSSWCPACNALVEFLGGTDAVEPVYVECSIHQERCDEERIATSIPEIQINSELHDRGDMNTWLDVIEDLSNITGCEIPN